MATFNPETQTENKPYEYQVLVPDAYHTHLETNETLHELYITKTADLIKRIAGDKAKGLPGYDTVVFLDKSARPLSWMVRGLWDHVAPQTTLNEQTGKLETPPMPRMKFINIDRLKWRKDPSTPIDEPGGGMKDPTPEEIEGIRSIFNINSRDNLRNSRILIVDEQSETGDTLKVAKELMQAAFPSSDIEGMAWIKASKVSGYAEVREIPVWYPMKDQQNGLYPVEGRGVYDPTPDKPLDPRRYSAKSGMFLGRPPRVNKTEQALSEHEKEQVRRLEAERETTDSAVRKKAITAKISKIYRGEYDKKSQALRDDITHMIGDFLGGKLFPMVLTDRATLAGMPKTEYNKIRQQIQSAKRFKNAPRIDQGLPTIR